MISDEPATRTAYPFTVMAKPVGASCNLRCGYCYYSNPLAARSTGAQKAMTGRTLELFIRQYIQAVPGPEVSFVWHGGEPTLAGLDFYRAALTLQQKYLPAGWICLNNIQTNGVLLDDEWCSFLAKAHFDVGLSIDGTSFVHDTYRKDAAVKGTYKPAADAIRRLQKYGIQPDLLCTVTSTAADDPLSTYRALRDFRTGWIQFIPIVRIDEAGRVTSESVTPAGYGDFLCSVFDEWLLNDLGILEVQLFAETSRVWSGGSAGLCWMAPACGRALIVECDGSVYSCDHFVSPAYNIGNIAATPLLELSASSEQKRFGETKRNTLPARCLECEWIAACGGGCPKNRFVRTEDGENALNYLCEGLNRFFSYSKPAFDFLIKHSKAGYPAAVVMARLRESLKDVWKGVGRNSPCPCGSGRKAKHCCWDKRI